MNDVNHPIEGCQITALRRRLGLSQVEFAALLGVSNVTVNRWEHARSRPEAKLHARIAQLERDSAQPSHAARPERSGNLITSLSGFVGRTVEISRLERLIETQRLVTLTGPAGSGKTRLSVELGRKLTPRFPDGVWFVDLAPVLDANLVVDAGARAFDVGSGRAPSTLTRLLAAIRSWSALVIVDNCEHVAEAASAFVDALVRGSDVHVLATSRAALNVAGETVFDLAALSAMDALALFLTRATAAGGPGASQADLAIVADICRRLDHLPLAIELAASRTALLSLAQVRARLDDRFAFLRTNSPISRTSTLEAAIAWSYDQLTDPDQRCFRALGVFAGRFTMEAIEAICGQPGPGAPNLVSQVETLVHRSLVTVHRDPSGFGRGEFQLLESLRAYALAKLTSFDELDETVARHADYFHQVVHAATALLIGPDRAAALRRIDDALDNAHAALQGAIHRHDVRRAAAFAASLWPYWHARGEFAVGARWLDQTLTLGIPPEDRDGAEIRTGLAIFRARLGEYDQARRPIDEALAGWRTLGDRAGEARALGVRGLLAQRVGDPDGAEAWHRRALEIWTEEDAPAGMADSLTHLGQIANLRGQAAEAERLYLGAWKLIERFDDPNFESALLNDLGDQVIRGGRVREALGYYHRALRASEHLGQPDRTAALICNIAEARLQLGEVRPAVEMVTDGVARYRQLGNRSHLADALYILGAAQLAAGANMEALRAFQEAVALYHRLGNAIYAAQTIEATAKTLLAFHEQELAARWLGAAAAIRRVHGIEPYPLLDYDGLLATIAGLIGRERLATAMAGGADLAQTHLVLQVVTYEPPPPSEPEANPSAGGVSKLTARQAAVLRLVAAGGSNRQIAATLALSERTVERHLSAIYAALDVSGRSGAVAYAVTHGVVASGIS